MPCSRFHHGCFSCCKSIQCISVPSNYSLLIRPSSTSFARKLSAFADSALPKSVTEPPAEYNQGINWKVPSSFPLHTWKIHIQNHPGFVVALLFHKTHPMVVGGSHILLHSDIHIITISKRV